MSDNAAIGRVAVVGTGVIGASWAALFLAAGHDVMASDPAPGAEERLRAAVADAWPMLTRLGLRDGASQDRLTFVADLTAAVAHADFVQESGPERIELKQEIFTALDGAAPADAVIASSSSGLRPSELQELCANHPERVLVGHPFNPAHLVPLVEVVPGARTNRRSLECALSFYRSLGKRPIHVRKELRGHVANRLQAALWQEAYSLVERGAATVADIDTAISHGPGLRWALVGPLAGQHLSGGEGGMAHTLAHLGPPAQEWMDDLRPAPLTPELTRALVEGVDAELADVDQRELVRQRDDLLVALIEQKRALRDLP